eukprot:Hpha_TRINITY_DN16691_c1_g6::TRINITY_DN16691_c1_g6_i1::g.179609::m.179609
MGGHGRALEVLEEECKDMEMSAEEMMQVVSRGIRRKYISLLRELRGDDWLQVVRCALAGRRFGAFEHVPGTSVNPELLPMVRVVDLDGEMRRIELPYLWLYTALRSRPGNDEWRLGDYGSFADGGHGVEWEVFNAQFRALRSKCFGDGEEVLLQDLHFGGTFGSGVTRKVNRHLTVKHSKHWIATTSTNCGQRKRKGKPAVEPPGPPTAVETKDGGSVKVIDGEYIVVNPKGAPAADAVVALKRPGEAAVMTECLQMKARQEERKVELAEERSKSCAEGDLLMLLSTAATPDTLPEMTGFVGKAEFPAYYSMYAARAVLYCPGAAQRLQSFST